MRDFGWFGIAASLALAACATTTSAPERKLLVIDDPAFDAITSSKLETFASDAEFVDYLKRAKSLTEARGYYWAARPVRLAQADIPCEPGEPCETIESEQIVVTGARISGGTSSITNTQKAGVDEGDIVKNVGRFLIVLQDGRLFSIDTGAAPGGMRLVDRENVYRDPKSDAWCDEMVVSGDRIVVLGYSYDQEASEIAVFRLKADGTLNHQATYYISSDDYYSGDNYATRLVGDKLIVYTPYLLDEVDPEAPLKWPLARRWIKEGASGRVSPGENLYRAKDIFKPIQRTIEPVVHAVSICPITTAPGSELDCRTTAIIGPNAREFYVSDSDVFLWISASYRDIVHEEAWPAKCPAGYASAFGDSAPAAAFRIPLSGAAPTAARARGYPRNQFSLDSNKSHFRALLDWSPHRCDPEGMASPLRFLSLPLNAFSATPRAAPARRYANVPSIGTSIYENRFTDDYVVYGGRADWSSYAPDPEEGDLAATVVAVPTARPERPVVMNAPHNVIRAERAGDDIVLTGYKNAAGLSVSLVKLGGPPRISDTEVIEGRYESEGRSHAFNSDIGANGVGLMGLPTVEIEQQSGRWVFRSDASDVSFLAADAEGSLQSIGALKGSEDSENKDYACEVSCVDWYGNTRPIFLGGRVFGLSGAELIEGRVEGGRMAEIARVNITAPVQD